MNDDSYKSEQLIIDTHILLWYLDGVKLSERQVEVIEQFRKNNNLFISTISFWEVAMLYRKGSVIFSLPLAEWIDKVLSIEGLHLIDLSISILTESCNLHLYSNKDPADRLIIAAARSKNAYLMTMDQKIIEYGNLGYLKLL